MKAERGQKGSRQSLDSSSLEELESLLDHVVEKYRIDYRTLSRIINEKEHEILIPAIIFRDRSRSITQIAFSYLKHNHSLALESISRILNLPQADARELWDSSPPSDFSSQPPFIPARILGNSLSPLESLVEFLRERRMMKNRDIARLLNRNPKTIWTVYARAKNKFRRPEWQRH